MHIEINGVAKSYHRRAVLREVTFAAKDGECIGILGGNGCGKSTLLSILAGVQPADKGSFLLEGNDLFRYTKVLRERVGYVPQGTPLMEELTARDNLRLWYTPAELARELDGGVLSMLGVNEFLKMPVSKMSGGMKKRLSIGCAVAKRPSVLLLDEPMTALDLACKQRIFAYLEERKRQGDILVLVTHDVMEMQLCDRWYVLKDGVLAPYLYDGDREKLAASL
ncbi:MAG: ABC transporter ATP-binding protein [Ruminococcaceae bacterium]|nr:ABC transporter ATP-binding protein [Oscillospiraceae bacterium]